MALNPKIVEKIKSKTRGEDLIQEELLYLLGQVEEGKQPKRVIEKVMSYHHSNRLL